jgi:hypothetical protein
MVRKVFNRVYKLKALEIHQESNGGTVGAATKAMIKLLLRTDCKRWGFFVVKRATGLEFAAGALEGDTALYDLNDIDAPEEFLDKGVRDQARHSSVL